MAPSTKQVIVGVAAAVAAGTVGYYAWTRYSQAAAGGGSGAAAGDKARSAAGPSRQPRGQADGSDRIEQSRRLLAAEWEAINRDETRGFVTWWGIAEVDSKMKLLQAARELFQARLAESGVAGPLLLQLCPELGDSGLGRIAAAEEGGGTVPALIHVRIHEEEACARHDRAFVHANIGGGADEAKLEATVYNRPMTFYENMQAQRAQEGEARKYKRNRAQLTMKERLELGLEPRLRV